MIVCTAIVTTGFLQVPPRAEAGRIDATRGREYGLTKDHGPWMILVASIRDVPEERRLSEGKGVSARDAANELVYELRNKKIPAYVWSADRVVDQVETVDRRTGQPRQRSFIAQQGRIVVLAGNYAAASDWKAQKTLDFIKERFRSRVLEDERNGGLYRPTPGRPTPMSGAFLTMNPLLSPEEVMSRRTNPLIRRLNTGIEHSLLKNRGKYTLVIASFHGQSATQISAGNKLQRLMRSFDAKIGESLDNAALKAFRLAHAMRDATSNGYDKDYEAWVFHERHKSVVTIGSFDSSDDPRIRALYQLFSAKPRSDPSTGNQVLAAEVFTVPRQPAPGKAPDFSWFFDPSPQLIEVPRLR